jgi:antitoxin VapB
MAMNIKNPEAHHMAQELAELRGLSITQAVTEAIREGLDREKRRHNGKPLSTELLEIGRRCAMHVKKPVHSRDHARFLYDNKGLPK